VPIVDSYGLPSIWMRAIQAAEARYSKGSADASVTQLIAPAQQQELIRQHKHEIKEELVDKLWAFDGTLVHLMLELAGPGDNDIIETRVSVELEGWTVSGQIDLYSERHCTIYDVKRTSIYALKDGMKPEWEAQLNCYRYLWTRNFPDLPVEQLRLMPWYKDWEPTRGSEFDYPDIPIEARPVTMWTLEKTEDYLRSRIKLHQAARDGIVAPCTRDERWQSEDIWRVQKAGKTIRGGKCTDKKQAYRLALEKGCTVVYSAGRAVRCRGTERLKRPYCPVAAFCPQLRKELDS